MSERYKDLFEYLNLKEKALTQLENEIKKYPTLISLFIQNNWFNKVKSQIDIWRNDPEGYIESRAITVTEYELFRYLTEDSILNEFINSFLIIEDKIDVKNEKQLLEWNHSKSQIFSSQVNQIYSTLFEILLLGKLASNNNIDLYYENIDGRNFIEKRFIYFEIKSLQKTTRDLRGIGVRSTEADKHQIYRALKEKNRQLNKFRNYPTLIFLSLYRLTDMTTAWWYIPEYFEENEKKLRVKNNIICGVKVYSWFTVKDESAFYVNPNAIFKLTDTELEFFIGL